MTVKIYQLKDLKREVHMVGDYVGVCLRIESVKKQIKGEDGLTYTAEVWQYPERKHAWDEPYIDFLEIRQGKDGEHFKAEDSPVHGGLDPKMAIKVAIELKQACDYILNKGWEKA